MNNANVKTIFPFLLVLLVFCVGFGQDTTVRLAIRRTFLTNSLTIEGVTGSRAKIETSDSLGG